MELRAARAARMDTRLQMTHAKKTRKEKKKKKKKNEIRSEIQEEAWSSITQ